MINNASSLGESEVKTNNFNIPKIKGEWINKGNLYLEEILKYKEIPYDSHEIISEKIKKIQVKKDTIFEPKIILDQIELIDQKNRKARLKDFRELGDVKISEDVYKKFEEIEDNWILIGKLTLEYTIEREEFYISEVEVLDFKCDLEEWINYQKQMPSYERIDLLLLSLGYNSKGLMLREKIFLLIRLIPLLQSNVNIIELTKRAVGKSYLYSHLFPNDGIIKNSTNTTEARLFGDLRKTNSKDIKGEINSYPVICFDEFHKATFKPEIIQELQMYAETGKVSRVNEVAKASLIFYGNIDENIEKKIYFGKGINIFEKLSAKNNNLIDAGFLDRIHFLNPTWGMRTLNGDILMKHRPDFFESERFPIAYLSKVFKNLRKIEIQESIFQKLGYSFENMNDRNITAITKITLGLLKIIFPEIIDKLRKGITLEADDYENINALMYLAMEGRYSILKQIEISKGNQEDPELKILAKNNEVIPIGDYYIWKKIINIFYTYDNRPMSMLPHRVIVHFQDKIQKIPLDIFGIDQNREEVKMKNGENLKNKNIHSSEYFNDLEFLKLLPNGSTASPPTNNYHTLTHGHDLSGGYLNVHNRYNQYRINGALLQVLEENKNYIYGYKMLPFKNNDNMYRSNSYYNLANIKYDFACECRYPFHYLERVNSEEFRCSNCKKIHSIFEIYPEKFEF